MNKTPYYAKHVFFCTRERSSGDCCMNAASENAQEHAMDMIKQLGLKGKGKVRISQTGCLGRCEEGPVMVVYPEGHWYAYRDKRDVEEIIRTDVIGGEIVTRLKI